MAKFERADFKGFSVAQITEPQRHNGRRCSACRFTVKTGDAYVEVVKGAHIHRSCIKRFMDWSYDHIPPTEFELEADELARHGSIEVGRGQREFDEYREQLLERYSQ